MKTRLGWLIFLFIITSGVLIWTLSKKETKQDLRLILNSANIEGELPRNFRICSDDWAVASTKKAPSRVGLESLHASGSGQFSEDGLREILSRLHTTLPVIVVDLRQESHGFANGIAVSWYAFHDASNVGKTLAEIEKDESTRLQNLLLQKQVMIEDVTRKPDDEIENAKSFSIVVEKVATEKELTESFKVGSFRIPVTDHLPPTSADVERFVQFVKSLPANVWLHFHCEAGDGRTTSFLSMYDMIRNAKDVSFDDIIERQHLLGGIDLAEMPEKSNWKYPHEVARYKFLQDFYHRNQ